MMFGDSENGDENFPTFPEKKPIDFPHHPKTMNFVDFLDFLARPKVTIHVWVRNLAKNGQNRKNPENFEIFRKFPKFWRGFHKNR